MIFNLGKSVGASCGFTGNSPGCVLCLNAVKWNLIKDYVT